MVPWALTSGDSGKQHHAVDSAPVLTQQPLEELAAGPNVREIRQDTPFSMVALTSSDLRGTSARVRARQDDGSWGPWYQADNLDGFSPDDEGPRGTEPVFVGRTTAVQIAVTRAEATSGPSTAPRPTHAQPPLGYVPANAETPIGQNLTAVLISPPQAPIDVGPLPTAVAAPGQPPTIISRAQWGADESIRCPNPVYDKGIRAGVVHHTAGSNEYAPEDSAGIIRSIYEYHTRTLGWCDLAYNAMVDKYGQVFEGRAGGMDKPVEGAHTGGFNIDTWGVAMMGDFNAVPPTAIQLLNTGRLLGWRLSLDHIDPHGTVVLASDGSSFTHFPRGATPTLPTIFAHRDVGITDCPGNAAYAQMDQIRAIAARFTQPPEPDDLAAQMRGGAIYLRWQATGGPQGPLGNPTSPETPGLNGSRYATFDHGAVYWSPVSGAAPVTGAIYEAWGALGFERGILGLPTSGEIDEPQWIVQNFQHGTLNFDRETGIVTRVVDGIPQELPPPSSDRQPVQLERFTPII